MKPAKGRPDSDLLAWAAAIIARAQNDKIHGEIRVQFKDGRIVSVREERSHLPPPAGDA